MTSGHFCDHAISLLQLDGTDFHTMGAGHHTLGCCLHAAWFTSASQGRCPAPLCCICRETRRWECQVFVQPPVFCRFGKRSLCRQTRPPPTGGFHEDLLKILYCECSPLQLLRISSTQPRNPFRGSPSPYSLQKPQVLSPCTELQATFSRLSHDTPATRLPGYVSLFWALPSINTLGAVHFPLSCSLESPTYLPDRNSPV